MRTRPEEATMSATKTAVAGATGRVGRHIVGVLRERGHDVVPISRTTGVDVVTAEGLAEALDGVDFIVDAATGPSPDEEEATAFFIASAHNLQELGQRAGVRRIVVLSIIGTDRFTGGYGAAKLAHEQAAAAGPIPATILRAAQFHEFVPVLVEWGRQGDVSYVPDMRTQLVAARSVAEAAVDLLDEEATHGTIPEVAGPREERLAAAARLVAARSGNGLRIEEVAAPTEFYGDDYRSDALLPGPHARLAGPTFEEWLYAGSSAEKPVRSTTV